MRILKRKKYSLLSEITKYSFLFVIAFVLVVPVFAVDRPCTGYDEVKKINTPEGCVLAAGTGDLKAGTGGINITTGIKNPIAGINDIPTFIKAILKFVVVVGVPIVSLAIIYSGFLFVTAQGNSEKLKKAKQTLLYTLIGAALLLGSFVIAESIKGTVDVISTENGV